MTTQIKSVAGSAQEVKTAKAKVTNIRIGKQGRAIQLGKGVLKRAGWLPGVRLQAIVLDDGSVLLRRESPPALLEEALFEQCASEVLKERHELLERLAK